MKSLTHAWENVDEWGGNVDEYRGTVYTVHKQWHWQQNTWNPFTNSITGSSKHWTLLGGKILMRFVYFPKSNETIIEHEDAVFKKYSEIIKGYEPSFAQYDCVLKVGQVWIKPHVWLAPNKRIVSYSRLSFDGRYTSHVYCEIQRNGRTVRYDNHDGEVDYYELSGCWNVSSIIQHLFHTTVNLCEDADEVIEELNGFLKILGSKDVDFI